jgi:hypothetical protein
VQTKFEDEAKKDKERYAKEMAAYGKVCFTPSCFFFSFVS